MKTLNNPSDRQALTIRLSRVSPQDTPRWGVMSVHQMVCHLHDSYKCPLGEKYASPATNLLQRTLVKRLALSVPLPWPRGVATRPEMEQGKGGSPPVDFHEDLAALLSTLDRFCDHLPSPCSPHPIFGNMAVKDWMRWGYLHADHHLRQFGR